LTEHLRRTQLYSVHLKTAKITSFAGFAMPLYYKDIAPEHLAVRNGVGIFDISHMGRVMVSGADSVGFLNYVVSNDVSTLSPNSAQYSVMCTEKGGIVDDFVVYRLEKERFLVVFNASNREKDYNWFVRNKTGFAVVVDDISDDAAMFAVQGPRAEKTLQKISSEDLSGVGRFKCCSSELTGVPVFLARTGYTGEDGFEVFVWNASISNPSLAVKVWEAILKAGEEFGITPCGLGARDTLRLEAGLCLYGNDIDETKTPLEAGLGFVVKLQKERFIGKASLLEQKTEGLKSKRVGIVMLEQGIPRPGFEVYSMDGKTIGQLTSGTFSPLLRVGVGMGYVETSQSMKDTIVNVNIRGKMSKAKVSAFPLYDPERYGYRRKAADA
jgi:glycine cleavage system T protein (aminomethyltransferase)